MKRFFSMLLTLCLIVGGSGGSIFAAQTHDYAKEKQVMQFRPHSGDKEEIKASVEQIFKNIKDEKALTADIAPDVDAKPIQAYLKTLSAYSSLKLDSATFLKFYNVEGYKANQDFRAIVKVKYIAEKDGKKIEFSDFLHFAKLGKEPTDWKITGILFQDSGIDVSDVSLAQLDMPKPGEEICILHTEIGDIKMRLFPEKSPKTVANFKALAKEGFYNNMAFNRVIPNFVIQTVLPDGAAQEVENYSSYGGVFEDEFPVGLYHFRGAVSMGNAGPNTNGNQFYIVQTNELKEEHVDLTTTPLNVEAKYKEIGGFPYHDFRYAMFGQVYEGMELVDKIANQKTDEEGKPLANPIRIKTVEFKKY